MKYDSYKSRLNKLTLVFILGALPVFGLSLITQSREMIIFVMSLWVTMAALVFLLIKLIDIIEALPEYKSCYLKKNYLGLIAISFVLIFQMFFILVLVVGGGVSQ